MNSMQHFHEYQVFEKCLNAMYVALIPKKRGVFDLSNFRPISLTVGYISW